MKEILYFQAGTLSNYIGTHFWNAQDSYFTYGEDAEDPLVDHDVSFREGRTVKGEPTYCPRLIVFDRKSNFGAVTDVYGVAGDELNESVAGEWNGDVVEYRQEPISKSEYHAQLEADGADNVDTDAAVQNRERKPPSNVTSVRYWSDYSHVDYHPRSLHRLPDAPDWEDVEGDWTAGATTFDQYNEGTGFMEDAFRLFVEECDNLQGLQLLNDTPTFGSFTSSFLTKFRDDFVKLPCLTFSISSPHTPKHVDADNIRGIKQALNDALTLKSLYELSTISVSLQSPSTWALGDWLDGIQLARENPYQTSAILATHIESATLPLRLKGAYDDMTSVCSILDWRGNTRLAQLGGIFPMDESVPFDTQLQKRLYDFSIDRTTKLDPKSIFASSNVSRGFSATGIAAYNIWAGLFQPMPNICHAPSVALPTSFPALFKQKSNNSTVKVFSTLQTGSNSASTFSAYASLVVDCLGKHAAVVSRMGLETDDIRELRDNLWTLADGYEDVAEEDILGSDGLGQDEEY